MIKSRASVLEVADLAPSLNDRRYMGSSRCIGTDRIRWGRWAGWPLSLDSLGGRGKSELQPGRVLDNVQAG